MSLTDDIAYLNLQRPSKLSTKTLESNSVHPVTAETFTDVHTARGVFKIL